MAIKLLTVLLVSIFALTFVSSAIIRVAKVEDDEMIAHEFLMNKIDAMESESESESFSVTESMSEMPSETMTESMSEMEESDSKTPVTPSPSISDTASETPSETATASESASISPSSSITLSPSDSVKPSTTISLSESVAPSVSISLSETLAPSVSISLSETVAASISNSPSLAPSGGAQLAAAMSIATDKSAADFTPAAINALADAIAAIVKYLVSITSIKDVKKGNGVEVNYIMYIPAGVDLSVVMNTIAAIPASDFTASMNTKLQAVDSSFVITGATVPTLEVVPPAGQSNTYTFSSSVTKSPSISISNSVGASVSSSKTATGSHLPTTTKSISSSRAASATPTKPTEVPTSGSYTATVVISIVSVFLFAVFA